MIRNRNRRLGMRSSNREKPVLPSAKPVKVDPNTPAGTTWVNPNDGLTYVWIPPGKFTMGCSPGDTNCDPDEKPREITIDRGFWMGQTLVTQGAYKRVTGENPSFYKHGEQYPVDKVDYIEAYGYCVAVGYAAAQRGRVGVCGESQHHRCALLGRSGFDCLVQGKQLRPSAPGGTEKAERV